MIFIPLCCCLLPNYNMATRVELCHEGLSSSNRKKKKRKEVSCLGFEPNKKKAKGCRVPGVREGHKN